MVSTKPLMKENQKMSGDEIGCLIFFLCSCAVIMYKFRKTVWSVEDETGFYGTTHEEPSILDSLKAVNKMIDLRK